VKYRLEQGSPQWQFNKSRKKVQLFGGGFGNGKTAGMCIKAIQLAFDYPGSNGLIARASYVKLNDTIRKEFFKWLPPGAIARMPTTTDNTLYLKNGTTINFRYIAQRGKKTSDGYTTSNLLSATYDWAFVDQLEDPEIQHKDFLDILGRLRGSTPYKGNDPTMPMSGPRWFGIGVNPTANWVYTKLVKPYHIYKSTGKITPDLLVDQDSLEPIIDVIEGSTMTNASNLDADFIGGLRAAYKGQMYDRFVLGKWAAYEGLVYPEFSRDMHMVPHERIMKILREQLHLRNRYEGLQGFDLGMIVPSCYLLGFTDEEGNVFIVDGFYRPTQNVATDVAEIKALQDLYRFGIRYSDPIWADPQIFKKNQLKNVSVTTVAKMMRDEGLDVKPGQNAIENGIMKVSGYLSILPHGHIDDPNRPGPRIYFSDKLQFIADEFLGYFWMTNTNGERVDKPMDRNDHAMDTLKFMVSRLPDPTDLIFRKPVPAPEYMKWRELH
jgi:hypothetical protein